MRRISAMYQLSGGGDYHHDCRECAEYMLAPHGKRKAERCQKYQSLTGAEPDWKGTYMACMFFREKIVHRDALLAEDPDLPGKEEISPEPKPENKSIYRKKINVSETRQMSLSDYI